MKGFLIFLLSLIIVGTIIFFVPPLHNKAQELLTYHPCDTPLQYKLGSVDPKFNFTDSEVIQDMRDATEIWNNKENKTLFTYSPKAELTVSFVYDERTALNNQINELQSQLSQSNSTLSEQIAEYKKEANDFEQKRAAFDAEVQKYNTSGGAPQDVYDMLKKEQQDINAEVAVLNQKAKDLNLSTHDYNSDVSLLNGDIHEFNGDIAAKPEEGLYDGKNNTITIYLVNSHNELIHTLAHEFGHSLGMGHVEDPKGIMYSRTSTFLDVTTEDMAQLITVCKEQSALLHMGQQVDIWLANNIERLQQNLKKSN